MFRKIYYISVWVRSVLNCSWNCFAYSDKVCMSLCINFITCFIWGYYGPQFLSKAAFSSFYVFCVFSLLFYEVFVLMAGIEVIVVWLEFVILQDDLFSLILFLCLEFQFHFASFLLFSVCLAVITSTVVFLLVLRLRRTLNVEFIAELHIF